MSQIWQAAPLLALGLTVGSYAGVALDAHSSSHPDRSSHPASSRKDVIARSQVWVQTDVHAKDLKAGPGGHGAFPPGAMVECDFVNKKLDGASPKFACRIAPDDEVKVKYGGNNGEVYGEMLATRLLWSLGFGADRMYSVNVICRGCPAMPGAIERPGHEWRFDPALIERKMGGAEWATDGKSGWSWNELDQVDPDHGGAPRAQRDALKLLAVFLQHTDSKPQQQRLVCQGESHSGTHSCERPFMMINDVGLTFGRANRSNASDIGGVNLVAWQRTPVWKAPRGCTGNLPKSLTGTLNDPVISEDGRSFLADLLVQLSDQQIADLFESARVTLRLRSPGDVSSGYSTIDEWVQAFKEKRQQILDRRCA